MGENIHNINVMYIGNKRCKASFPLCRTIMYLLVYINDLNLQKKNWRVKFFDTILRNFMSMDILTDR